MDRLTFCGGSKWPNYFWVLSSNWARVQAERWCAAHTRERHNPVRGVEDDPVRSCDVISDSAPVRLSITTLSILFQSRTLCVVELSLLLSRCNLIDS